MSDKSDRETLNALAARLIDARAWQHRFGSILADLLDTYEGKRSLVPIINRAQAALEEYERTAIPGTVEVYAKVMTGDETQAFRDGLAKHGGTFER